MIKRIMFFFIPIYRSELKKFLCMGVMLLLILFNYNVLRTLKDALIAPNIGVEAIAFVDTYLVIPISLLFALLYSYLSHIWKFEKVFCYIFLFFLGFFLAFIFVLYPYQEALHPTRDAVDNLINSKFEILSFTINMSHFKWLIKLYGKWVFATLGVFAELWGSIFIFLFYWQLANNITETEEAKRFYPMSNFIGHIGTFLAGAYTQYAPKIPILTWFQNTTHDHFISNTMLVLTISLILTFMLFIYISHTMQFKINRSYKNIGKGLKSELGLKDSLKVIFTSSYLWLITALVFFYGVSINMCENLWKVKLVQAYSDTNSYASIYGHAIKWIGICSMICMVISTHVLRKATWLIGAIATPITMLLTGGIFLIFFLLNDHFNIGTLHMVVVLGTIQIVLTKGVKYALFDATKEMAFIPTDEHTRSKGKAAVDVVGLRMAKASGALLQSSLFIMFPAVTYMTLAPYMSIVVAIVCLLWIKTAYKLNKQYIHKIALPER